MTTKYFTFLVVPHDERSVRRVRVSYRTLKVVAALLILATLGTAVAVATYGRVATRATRAAMLERENARLEEENAKVTGLARNLERTEQAYQQIRALAGLDDIGEQNRGRSVGEATKVSTRTPSPRGASPPGTPGGWPLTIEGFVTSRFSGATGHPGIDIAVPLNTPVVATADGSVGDRGYNETYGHYIVLDHAGDLSTMYAHNALLVAEPKALVRRGETVAYSGNSGRSTAPHLHYEIRRAGTAIDPGPYLR